MSECVAILRPYSLYRVQFFPIVEFGVGVDHFCIVHHAYSFDEVWESNLDGRETLSLSEKRVPEAS